VQIKRPQREAGEFHRRTKPRWRSPRLRPPLPAISPAGALLLLAGRTLYDG
jgi:hypothetical protein